MSRPELNIDVEATEDTFELLTPKGTMAMAVVIKQLFGHTRSGEVFPLPGAEIHPVDVPWPDGQSAMLPTDLFLFKPSTDVVVAASAVAPEERTTQLDVVVQVGPVEKVLSVFGPRAWFRDMMSAQLTEPEPFSRLPLMWEHAWGGMDASDPSKAAIEHRNPYGTGLACKTSDLIGTMGPRIEEPGELINSAWSRPAPAGVAAIGPNFEPRRSYAGTHDQKWQDERMPLPPRDFDPRHNQVATPDLVSPKYLTGGEPVKLLNIGRAGATRFMLPWKRFGVLARCDDADRAYRPVLDTVVIRADEERFEMTWRAPVPLPRGERRVREIQVFEKSEGSWSR